MTAGISVGSIPSASIVTYTALPFGIVASTGSQPFSCNTSAGKTIIELPAGFAERYTKETSSIDDPAKLGNKKDLMALFDKVREKTCAWAATLTPADMAKPTPEKMRQFVPTVGHLANMIPVHVAMHIGQIQVLRRKLGKPILF